MKAHAIYFRRKYFRRKKGMNMECANPEELREMREPVAIADETLYDWHLRYEYLAHIANLDAT